jgi:transcriptional regulator with XRE-family HTH domain
LPLKRIRDLRKERGLTQAELAKVLKVSARTIGFYETGERDPDTDTLKKLADFFCVSIDYLLSRLDVRDLSDKTPYCPKKDSSGMIFDEKHEFEEELPLEAKEEIEKFKEFIKYKYGKK